MLQFQRDIELETVFQVLKPVDEPHLRASSPAVREVDNAGQKTGQLDRRAAAYQPFSFLRGAQRLIRHFELLIPSNPPVTQ